MNKPTTDWIGLQKESAKKAMCGALDAYIYVVEEEARRLYDLVLVPFLKRRRWSFWSGMGDFGIGPKGKVLLDIDRPDDEEFQAIYSMLMTQVPGLNDAIGCWMPNYPAKRKSVGKTGAGRHQRK